MRMVFKLKKKCGNHVDENGKKYVAGDEITTSRRLDEIFKGKFELVREIPESEEEILGKPIIPDPTIDEDDDEDDEEVTISKKVMKRLKKKYGKDVSEKFDHAITLGISVFYKNGKGYTCIDPADTSEPMNDKKLKKAGVDDFLEEYLDEDEE